MYISVKGFYRAVNAIFGKVGRIASELEVVLQQLLSKCIPILLYGLESCPLGKSDLSSLDFVINCFYKKCLTPVTCILFRVVS